jgi:hypothetical protein
VRAFGIEEVVAPQSICARNPIDHVPSEGRLTRTPVTRHSNDYRSARTSAPRVDQGNQS